MVRKLIIQTNPFGFVLPVLTMHRFSVITLIKLKFLYRIEVALIMNRDTLEKRVKELMVDKTKVEKISQIDNTAPISEYFNSISYIQFVIAVEDEFDLDFEDEILDAANFKNLNDVINILLDIIQKNDLEQ